MLKKSSPNYTLSNSNNSNTNWKFFDLNFRWKDIYALQNVELMRTLLSNRLQKFTINLLMNQPLAQLFSAHAIDAGGLRFTSRVGQIGTVSPTARHRCDVSSQLCIPCAKQRRWAPPLVTRFGVLPRV